MLETTHLCLKHLKKVICNLAVNGGTVVFVWLPSHVGIKGNADADLSANMLVPHSDFRLHINQYFESKLAIHLELANRQQTS